MRRLFHSLIGAFFFATLFTASALAGSPASDVTTSLAAQNRWLGSGKSADGWKKYLKHDELTAELAKGSAADRKVVAEVLKQYESGASGLHRPQFAAVRKALAAWQVELSAPTVAELPNVVTEAKKQLAAPDAKSVPAAKAKLVAALANLDRYLARSGAAGHQGWHTYLQWEKLQAELAKEAGPDLKVLDEVAATFFQNQAGLEQAQFTSARQALKAYRAQVALANEKDWKVAGETRLDEIVKRLGTYQQSGSDEEAVAIGQLLGELHAAGLSPEVVSSVRRHYTQENIHVHASRRLIGAGIDDDVNDVSPVSEVILETQIRGTAHTVGKVSVRTVPSNSHAVLDILMNGYAYSRNVGHNGPVTLHTNGTTSLSAFKRLVLDANGLHSYPASASASTNTQLTSLDANLNIIRKIGQKQYHKKSSQAEAIASQRAAGRLERRIDAQAAEMLAKAHDSFVNKFRLPLLRKGEFPQRLHFATTDDGLNITALMANTTRLGAPTVAPQLTAEHDLSVRVHESLVGNAVETILAGMTLTDEKLAEMMKEATGEVPEELQISEDKDPWSITFSDARPVAATFTGNTCTLAIHARGFTRGDQEIKNDILISAKYKLEQAGQGSKLTREGDVTVDFVNSKGSLSVSQVAFKTFIRRKFSSLFKPEIANDGLKLPGRWERAGKLVLRQMEADKGWLTLGWEQPANVTTLHTAAR